MYEIVHVINYLMTTKKELQKWEFNNHIPSTRLSLVACFPLGVATELPNPLQP